MSRDRAFAAALFIIATGVYVWTLCPSVYVEGSGELIGATWWLGTPHPTGYPLYTLLARLLAASMPMSSPAAAVNAATALLSAAVAPALYLLLRERAAEGGVELGFTIEDDAPTVRADSVKLQRMLLNLLTNAIKFTLCYPAGWPAGAVKRCLSIKYMDLCLPLVGSHMVRL